MAIRLIIDMKKTIPMFFLLMFFLYLTGCSNGVKVTGTVKLVDGTPITQGSVVFDSKTDSFFGDIKSDGSYVTGGVKPEQKIPYGIYTVWLSGTEKIANHSDSSYDVQIQIAKKYTSASTSGLQFELKPGGPKTFDIIVEKP